MAFVQSGAVCVRARRAQPALVKCVADERTGNTEDGGPSFVLAHYEATELLGVKKRLKEARDAAGLPVTITGPFSVDVGKSAVPQVQLNDSGVDIGEDSQRMIHVAWKALEAMTKKGKTGAFLCSADGWSRIAGFSELTQRPVSLLPVRPGVAPTAVLGGFGMHRIKSSDPTHDTQLKMRALGRMSGDVLDICTGLGYTAIAAAQQQGVDRVLTLELDPAMVELQGLNPWSQELFTNPKIERVVEDAVDVLPRLPAQHFAVIVHDPPAQALSGELYGSEFYAELRRVLKPRGRLFHYIGDPKSKESGRLFRGVMERLRGAGFEDVRRADAAFGVVAS